MKHLARIFHTEASMRRRAKLMSTRRAKDCDAGLYEHILLKSQFETNTVIMSFPQAAIDLV
jgi:hypothetical protein